MYQMKDAVLCQVHATFNAGAATLQLKALDGSPPWRVPPATTDAAAGTPTYGAPYLLLTLMDVANRAAAKIEVIRCKFNSGDIGGGVYEATSCERGLFATTDQSWPAGSLVLMQIGAAHLALETETAIARAQHIMVHSRDVLLTWNGSNFSFGRFRPINVGKGKHFGTDGFFEVVMPGNGSTITGHGGASNHVVSGGVIAIPANQALYYELPIGEASTAVPGNFRLVQYTSDFVVPKHWLLIAAHHELTISGEGALRVCNGVTLFPWREIQPAGTGGGAIEFQNSWINFGAPTHTAAFVKGPDQVVRLKGTIKSGTITSVAFTLPAGCRPAASSVFAVDSNGGFGRVVIDAAGQVNPTIGSAVSVALDGISFLAAA